MAVAYFIGFLALVLAVTIVVSAVRKRQRDAGAMPTWGEVKEAFTSHSLRGAREESAIISEPAALESDLRVGQILEFGEEGSGYLEPRDILATRPLRN